MRLDDRQAPAELSDRPCKVPLAKIRAPETEARSGQVEWIPKLLGARQSPLTEREGLGKLPDLGEAPCEKRTGEGVATAPSAWTAAPRFALKKVDDPGDGAGRRAVVSEGHQRQARIERRLALELAIPEASRDRHRALSDLTRALVVSYAPEVVTSTDRHQGLPVPIPESGCHALRFLQERAEAGDPPHLRERVPQGDPYVDALPECAVGLGETVDRVESMLEARHRLDVGGPAQGPEAGPREVGSGFVPDLSLAIVDPQSGQMRVQVTVVE